MSNDSQLNVDNLIISQEIMEVMLWLASKLVVELLDSWYGQVSATISRLEAPKSTKAIDVLMNLKAKLVPYQSTCCVISFKSPFSTLVMHNTSGCEHGPAKNSCTTPLRLIQLQPLCFFTPLSLMTCLNPETSLHSLS
uniref:Uncharacterized protein n=1 Tax=Opuntia streptacantha TaxID=393608 RepID=A0A7C9EGF8_OPUST